MNPLLIAVAALALAGCGGQATDTLVVSSDPALARAAREVLPDLAARSGLELREPVRLERRSRAELERYLLWKLDEEMPAGEARHTARSYALLGLVPDTLDLRALLLSVYTEQVVGFYDPDSTALFVLEGQPPEALRTILVHELVHALQDQSVSLDSLTSPRLDNDRRTAAQAAIEGHATLVMMEHMAAGLAGDGDVDLTRIPNLSEALGPALEAMDGQYPSLAAAPRIVRESLLFPYLHGASYVQDLWQVEGGRPPPFGVYLPLSTEQVLEPERLLGPASDPPTEVRLEVDGRILHEEVLGQFEVGVLLAIHLGEERRSLARGWDGDRFLLLEGPEEGESLVWVVVWDDASSRDAFVAALSEAEDFPRGAEVVAGEAGGRPLSELRIGRPPPVQVTLAEPGTASR